MSNYNFISYSSVDALDFALQLYDSLLTGPPSIPVWLDKREIKPGQDWDKQIVESIRICESLIFVMTHDSVEDESVCKLEWTWALKYKKAIVPILLQPEAEMPFRLGSRQYIDFTGDFDTGLAQLRLHLRWLASPEGVLQSLKDRLEDDNRDLRRARDLDQEARIKNEIALLKKQIEDQQFIIDDPEGAVKRVEESITRGIERERQPERPVSGVTHTNFINNPPAIAPTYFQDRYVETKLIGDFLHNDAQCLMTIVGRAGIGKTAMVCRLLKSLEGGQLPDNGKEMHIDGIVYLSMTGSRQVTVPNLYADLSRLLSDDVAKRLDDIYKNPKTSTESKMQALMGAFPAGRVILLLDNFEDLIDHETRKITSASADMDEALRALLNLPPHAVKVIMTTRLAPRDLMLIHPERQFRLELEKGLESPYAENILREMDADGTLGLKSASDELLSEARERTLGNPRALEALIAILSADRDTTLPEILSDQRLLPENVVEVLIGEAFSRLDSTAQMVMEALAIYGHPVTPSAIDYLLYLHLSGVDSAPVLKRLVNMHFVRKEAGRYYMHPVDREYALSRVPDGDESDRDETIFTRFSLLHRGVDYLLGVDSASVLRRLVNMLFVRKDELVFTQFSLLHRGADYFKEARMSRENWKTIDDISAHIAEFDLRCAGQEYDTAAVVLREIDFDYLLLWGHYRVMAELHERLQGKLSDPRLKSWSAGNLGNVYHSMGDYQKAIEYHGRALAIAKENSNRQSEGIYLGNLGNAYLGLGQVQTAIDYYEQALKIARKTGDRQGKGRHLGNLGVAYSNMGQVQTAIDYYEQALDIASDIGTRQGEENNLGNLGLAYLDLGQVQTAIDYYEQALEIAREIGDRGGEGNQLGYLGNAYHILGQVQTAKEYHEQALEIAKEIGDRSLEASELVDTGYIFLDIGELNNAEKLYNQAIAIADEIEDVHSQNRARWGLALSQFLSGDLKNARSTTESARRYDYPLNNHNVLALMGVIALRQGDRAPALEAFEAAVEASDILLGHSDTNYDALDAKGLALCGLALCEGKNNYVEDAIHAYTKGRSITRASGIVGHVLGLFDELARADTQGLLAGVREAAGEK